MSTDAIRLEAGRPYFVKDPRATLSVEMDWTSWLAQEGTTITGSTWTAETPGITVSSPANAAGVTACVVSGGTAGNSYTLRNTITCADGSVDSRSIRAVCRDR